MEKRVKISFLGKLKKILAVTLAVVVTATTIPTDGLVVQAKEPSTYDIKVGESTELKVKLYSGESTQWYSLSDAVSIDFTDYRGTSYATITGVAAEDNVKVYCKIIKSTPGEWGWDWNLEQWVWYNESFEEVETLEYTFNVTSNEIKVSSIAITGPDTMVEGTDDKVSATATPADATNQEVTWSSDNAAITVDENGNLIAGNVDTDTLVTITATADDGSGVTGTKTITVKPIVLVSDISIGGVTTMMADTSTVLAATVSPDNASDKNITWSSSDESVATIDSAGNVIAKFVTKNTDVTFTAKSVDGAVTKTHTITVTPVPVNGVSITAGANQVIENQTLELTAVVSPNNAANKTLIWASDKSEIASVDSNGVVSAHSITKDEVVTITATTQDGSEQFGSIVLNVINVNSVEGITVTGVDSVIEGSTTKFEAVITPDNASNKGITWSSGDTSIATVDSNGNVKGKAIGQTTITATANDGSRIVGSKTIRVTAKNTYDVKFNKNGGSGSEYKMKSDENAAIIFPTLETTGINRSNYTFVGWSTDESGEGYNYYPGTQLSKINENKKFYAIWMKNNTNKEIDAKYYIRLDGAQPYEPSGYDSSDYSAGVWGTIKQGVGINNNDSMVASNLASVPTPSELVVDLAKSGITYDPNTQDIVWYVIKKGSKHWHVDGVIRNKSMATVSYDANGGSNDVMPPANEYVANTIVNVDFAHNPSKAGYQFLGWSTDKNAVTPMYTSNGTKTFTMGSEKVTLFAIWQAYENTQYKVSVYLGNGDGTYSYSTANSFTSNAKTDSTVTATAKDIEGYIYNNKAAGSVVSTTVKADGTSELKLYYDKKAAVTITANSATFVYDGAKHNVGETDYTVTGLPAGFKVSGLKVTSAGVTNVLDNSVKTEITGTPVIKDEKGTVVTNNYTITTQSGTISVTPANITVVASPASKTYGDSDTTINYGYTIEENKTLFAGNTLSVSYSRVPGEDVKAGGYAITPIATCNTGNYTVSVKPGVFTINPLAITVTPDELDKMYKQKDPTLTYTTSKTITDTMAKLDVTLSRTPGEAVGSYPLSVILGSNPNYTITTGTANFTIKQGEVTVTIENATKVYGDADPIFKYSISGTDYTEKELGLTFSRVKGEAVNTEGYKISVISNDANINLKVETGTLSITKRPITVAINNAEKTYGDKEPSYGYTVTKGTIASLDQVNGSTVSDKFKVTINREAGNDVKDGGYSLTPVFGGTSVSNYEITGVNGTLTVNPIPVTVNVDGAEKTFGESDPTTYSYTVLDKNNNPLTGISVEVNREEGEDAGTYNITASIASPNYSETVNAGVFTIQAKKISVSANSVSKTYGDADPSFTGRITDTNGNDISVGSEVSISMERTNATNNNVGTYAIIPTVTCADNSKGNKNYEITAVNGMFTINPFEVVVSADNNSKAYGDTDPALTSTVSKTLPYGDVLGINVTRTQGEEAGNYVTTANVTPNNNYKVTKVDGTFTITKKEIQVVINNASKVYGNADPVYSYALTGTTKTAEEIGLEFVRVQGENAGEYRVYAQFDSNNKNYDLVSVTEGKLIITKRPITVTAINASKVYGQQNPVFNYTIGGDGIANSDINHKNLLNVVITAPNVNDAGIYKISPSLTGSNANNYSVTLNDGTYEITKKALTVKAKNISATYGSKTYKFESEIQGLVNGDKRSVVSVSYNCVANASSNVGNYTITPIATSKNYAITGVDGTLTINPKTVNVFVSDKSKTYGTEDAVLTYRSDVPEAVVTLTRATGENVGYYPITAQINNENYQLVVRKAGIFTINKRNITLTVGKYSKTYGSASPTFTYTLSEELLPENTLNVSIFKERGENVRYNRRGEIISYELAPVISKNSSQNYNVKLVNGSLTINPFEVTVTADNKTITYGDEKAKLTTTMTPAALPFNDKLEISTNKQKGKNAGTYVITPKVERNGNYNVTKVNGTYTINPKAITVTADDVTATYGDEAYNLGYTLSSALVGKDAIEVTYKYDATKASEVGTYPITPVIKENKNYVFTAANGTITIGAKAITVTVADATKVYGDKDPASFEYTVEGADKSVVDSVYRVKNTEQVLDENVGTYVLSANVTNKNYKATVNEGSFSITQRPITVIADNSIKVYGDKDPQFTYTTSEPIISGNSISVNMVRAAGEDVKDDGYVINTTASFDTNNYLVSTEPGVLMVTKRPVKIIVPSVSKTYGESDPVFKYTVSDLGNTKMEGLSVPVVLSRVSGENAGTYNLLANVNSKNFTPSYELGTLVIGKKTVEVSVNDASKFVGEKDPVFTYSVDGLVGNDSLNISVVRYVGEAVGTYSIVAYVGSTNNYNVNSDYGTLTINALTTLEDGNVPLSPSLVGEAAQTTNRTPNNTTNNTNEANVEIAEDEVPLTDAPSVEGTDRQDEDGISIIDDEDTAKAAMLESDCWIHWLILLLTAVYSVFAIVRANQRNKKIREMEEEKETVNV